jgi:hypothetical protein
MVGLYALRSISNFVSRLENDLKTIIFAGEISNHSSFSFLSAIVLLLSFSNDDVFNDKKEKRAT